MAKLLLHCNPNISSRMDNCYLRGNDLSTVQPEETKNRRTEPKWELICFQQHQSILGWQL